MILVLNHLLFIRRDSNLGHSQTQSRYPGQQTSQYQHQYPQPFVSPNMQYPSMPQPQYPNSSQYPQSQPQGYPQDDWNRAPQPQTSYLDEMRFAPKVSI